MKAAVSRPFFTLLADARNWCEFGNQPYDICSLLTINNLNFQLSRTGSSAMFSLPLLASSLLCVKYHRSRDFRGQLSNGSHFSFTLKTFFFSGKYYTSSETEWVLQICNFPYMYAAERRAAGRGSRFSNESSKSVPFGKNEKANHVCK